MLAVTFLNLAVLLSFLLYAIGAWLINMGAPAFFILGAFIIPAVIAGVAWVYMGCVGVILDYMDD